MKGRGAIRCLGALALSGLVLAGCDGPQSALVPRTEEARRILTLTMVMVGGASAIFLAVIGITLAAIIGPPAWQQAVARQGLVIWGGVVFPVVVLSVLLLYGFGVLGAGGPEGEKEQVRIEVTGERWWWRVRYLDADGLPDFETANELFLPTGSEVELILKSTNVIHSFWVPAFTGKLDMVPGRTNSMSIVVDDEGWVRGQCAEYCGGAHALMAFYVNAVPLGDFEAWTQAQRTPVTPSGSRGERVFLETGCGACHAVRGTPADGRVGPDLTHVGSRRTVGAGVLPNTEEGFREWLERHKDIKPQNEMPSFDILTEQEIEQLALYLDGLK